jgi:S1-C subfamily serine protease
VLRTDVLGVYSQKLDPEQSKALGLPPEQGLSIERVEPGTIAQVIGLMRGDTLVTINSQPIYAVEDVRRILQERAADQELMIEIIAAGSSDPQTSRRTLRWTPREPQAPLAPREPQAPVQPKPLKKI